MPGDSTSHLPEKLPFILVPVPRQDVFFNVAASVMLVIPLTSTAVAAYVDQG